MSYKTAAIGLFTLLAAACNGLGNPTDDATNPFGTTSVPPWMGSSETGVPTTSGGSDGMTQGTTAGGVSDSASTGTPIPGGNTMGTSTGDATEGGSGGSTSSTTSTSSTSSSDSGGPPKLDLPPSMSTGNDEDKDKDKDKDVDSL